MFLLMSLPNPIEPRTTTDWQEWAGPGCVDQSLLIMAIDPAQEAKSFPSPIA
jgi:hypothetical protein